MESPFADIEVNTIWIHVALWAQENSLRVAKDGKFNGNEPCTRAEAMRYIWILSGCPAPSERASFPDLPLEKGYEQSISWAVEIRTVDDEKMQIAGGYKDGTFGSIGTCSRANIVTFLYRAWKLDTESHPRV